MLKSNEFNSIYNNSKLLLDDKPWFAHQHAIEIIKKHYREREHFIHQTAFKANCNEGQKFSRAYSELYKEAFEIVAQSIGLDGVHSDINTFMSEPSPYDKVHPMISFSDLCSALKSEAEKKGDLKLRRHFFNVASNDPDMDGNAVSAAVASLDLGSKSMYEHFSNLIETVPGFKKHAIQTIAASNRELAKLHGLSEVKLTKMHVYSYSEEHICCMDTTPVFLLKQEISKNKSQIDRNYYKYSAVLKAQYLLAIADVNRLFEHSTNDEYNDAKAVLQSKIDEAKQINACDDSDSELQREFDKVIGDAKIFLQELNPPEETKLNINAPIFKPQPIKPSISVVNNDKSPEYIAIKAAQTVDMDEFDQLSQEINRLIQKSISEEKNNTMPFANRFFATPLDTIIEDTHEELMENALNKNDLIAVDQEIDGWVKSLKF
jgi:hypothetical protein